MAFFRLRLRCGGAGPAVQSYPAVRFTLFAQVGARASVNPLALFFLGTAWFMAWKLSYL